MNQRFRELAKQTGYIWHASGDPQVYEFTPEKLNEFAELIVRECAKRVDYWESRQGEHTDDILKHFGVEE